MRVDLSEDAIQVIYDAYVALKEKLILVEDWEGLVKLKDESLHFKVLTGFKFPKYSA